MQRYTRPRTYRGVILAILAILALQVLGWFLPILNPITTIVHRISGKTYEAGVKVRNTIDTVFSEETIDVATLQVTIDGLYIENARLQTLADENKKLRDALGYIETLKDAVLTAQVISEVSDDAHNTLVLDKGEADGITIGQAVFVNEGTLIGKITDMNRRTSSVLLLTDSKSAVAVSIQNTDRTLGVLEGDRGLSMVINLIPQTETLTPGDIVVTSGIEPSIRRGLVIGTIDKVMRGTQEPFQSATVTPLFGSAYPTFVHILTPYTEDFMTFAK